MPKIVLVLMSMASLKLTFCECRLCKEFPAEEAWRAHEEKLTYRQPAGLGSDLSPSEISQMLKALLKPVEEPEVDDIQSDAKELLISLLYLSLLRSHPYPTLQELDQLF